MNFNSMLQYYDPSFENEEMISLAKETDDKELRDRVINNNIRVVVKLANKWKKAGYKDDLDDLVSLGLYGLVVAFDTFDTSKDIKFITYAGRVVWMEFVKAERYKHMKCRGTFTAISIETLLGKSDEGTDKSIAETLSNESHLEFEEVENKDFNYRLSKQIDSKLTDKEKYVSRRYFFDGMSFAEIGKEMNQSRQAAHQQFKKGLKKLAPVFA